jgi:hypothetical protein
VQVFIDAPHFSAGYDLETGRIAPIIKYMKDWSIEEIQEYCAKKGWRCQVADARNVLDDWYGD